MKLYLEHATKFETIQISQITKIIPSRMATRAWASPKIKHIFMFHLQELLELVN